jgi:hypothetical protein
VRDDRLNDYLARRAVGGPWQLELGRSGRFPGGIVIPALAEADNLPTLLAALTADPTLAASGMVVVVVVNNRADAGVGSRADNARSLRILAEAAPSLPFPLGIVDAASPGRELPVKDGGVGLARKIGHDLLLPHLDFATADPLLVSLDADTLVEPGYAGAIQNHFAVATAGGAVIPFAHRPGGDEPEERAIERYELFLRCYVAGLAHAGSPYAFHTVGSAMACRASAYVRTGGMNRRQAGEDFYFLQGLAKTAGVARVAGTTVHPSPRRSERVPFGTGRAMNALLDQEERAVLFYRPECYQLLREWLTMAREGCRRHDPALPHRAISLSSHLAAFFDSQGFGSAWERLLVQNRTPERLTKAFHDWFDAFRTMKLFHSLADGPYSRAEPLDLLSRFPVAWGASSLSPTDRLTFLRRQQNADEAVSSRF